ncbi:MAG: hypothetical protein CBC35_01950 [Planctomycetes bacterium TMED75]|nr:hypothetical protein [Planctomycetaceae bacterium]OUU96079.1 MAG: hypothetical protein CBC35_01950 [Planctomycetes bacterium TMED75]
MTRELRIKQLWLIRSCETDWELQQRIRGHTDLPIASTGRERLQACLDASIELDLIRHATDEPSLETARLLAKGLEVRRRRLTTFSPPDLGLFEGLTIEQATERFPSRARVWAENPIALLPPEGEALNEVFLRTARAFQRLLVRGRTARLGIVAHPVVIGCLRVLINRADSGAYHALESVAPRLEPYALVPALLEELRDRIRALSSG